MGGYYLSLLNIEPKILLEDLTAANKGILSICHKGILLNYGILKAKAYFTQK